MIGARALLGSALILLSASGCTYFNAMWTAQHYASDARHLEAQGQMSEARAQWALAAQKAGTLALKHPRSRWADDALVLEAEGLARSGDCEDAVEPITRADSTVKDRALRERLALASAQCALDAARPLLADSALAPVTASKDAGRRSRAEYLAGQSAMLRRDYDAAVAHLERSREPGVLSARVRAFIGAGRDRDAARALEAIAGSPGLETDRADLLAELAQAAGADTASRALDRMLAGRGGRLQFAEQARLLLADADRLLAAGEYDAAAARYRRAGGVAPAASVEAQAAALGDERVRLHRARTRDDLVTIAADLKTLAAAQAGNVSTKHLLDLVNQVVVVEGSAGERLRKAEIVRDSLQAPALAGQLFLDLAAGDTASLYAPKALLAALPLLPERHDSIVALLDSRYAQSPYTRAFHGEASVAYAAAEDSLARELGVAVAAGGARAGAPLHFDLPVPGPRGPQPDDVVTEPAAGAGPAQRAPRGPQRPGTRAPVRDRPSAPERP